MMFGLVWPVSGLLEAVYRFAASAQCPILTRQAVDVLVSRALADVSKARKLLSWHSLAPQEEGIRSTLEWLVTVDPSRWKVK
ncbi:MAG: hypothetical protein HGB26_08130 [Desulfobulbaceae bacterium]|nr:hypothetical protein [Desulfobulbaceae bacterium]